MNAMGSLAVGAVIAAALGLSVSAGDAQTRPAGASAPPAQAMPAEQNCLRALDGACTNPISVEEARLRAIVIPAVPVSYFGTPAGTVGGGGIPFERLFQDNPVLYGLPTFTLVMPCCVTRTK